MPRPRRPRPPVRRPSPGPARPAGDSNRPAVGPGRPAAPLPPGHVLLGEFGRAHGLRGEVRLKSYTADPLAIGRYGPLSASDGRTVALASLRQAAGDAPDLLIVRVEGVSRREEAGALNRLRLFVPRERLGEPDEDEFFVADLVGLRAVSLAGETLGRVVAVPDFGGGELLEIAPPGGGPTRLVPFTKRFVPAVDLPGGRVTVDPPDEAPDEDEPDGQDGGGRPA